MGKNKQHKLVMAGLLAALFGVSALYYSVQEKPVREPEFPGSAAVLEMKEERLKEFEGSYPAERTKSGRVVEYTLTVGKTEVEIIEGKKTEVLAINGDVPAPEIRVKLGDTLRITLNNEMHHPTTIHWHGLRIANEMDGVPHLTQEPIKPGESFVYEFTPKDAGSFWYHSHVHESETIEMGMHGALIVEDEYSEKYSKDWAWMIDDWLLMGDARVNPHFNTIHDAIHDGRWGNLVTINAKPQPTFTARPGERIRLRLLNPSNARMYSPEIRGAKAMVIATDAMYVKKPFELDGHPLLVGNRLDLDITIPEDSAGKSISLHDAFMKDPILLAKIDIEGEKVETPDFEFPRAKHFPNWDEAHKMPLDQQLTFKTSSGGAIDNDVWTIDREIFNSDTPDLKKGQFYKFRLKNDSFRVHPYHMHGMFFTVVARNGIPVEENYWLDTVMLKPREVLDIALVPLDVGKWYTHCHILEHVEAGMKLVYEVVE